MLINRLNLPDLAERALAAARRRNLTIVTAESCTAGKLSALLSEAPGAGEHLHGSFVTYTKANKVKALVVDAGLLKAKGAVCREVAVAMAEGALHRSPADVAVAVTGVAGPDPDEDGNPVGLVCVAVARDGREPLHIERQQPSRSGQFRFVPRTCRSLGGKLKVPQTDPTGPGATESVNSMVKLTSRRIKSISKRPAGKAAPRKPAAPAKAPPKKPSAKAPAKSKWVFGFEGSSFLQASGMSSQNIPLKYRVDFR